MISRVHPRSLAGVSLNSFRRYLLGSGWRQRHLKEGYSQADTPYELFSAVSSSEQKVTLSLPLGLATPDDNVRLLHAFQVVRDFEQRPRKVIVQEIKSVGYDVIRSAISSDAVYDDSVSIGAAKAFLTNMRSLVATVAASEVVQRPYFNRRPVESLTFADQCRFGHTYRGSFGFVIEAPLYPPPTLPLMAESVPLPPARLLVQRMARGMSAVETALADNSTEPLVAGFRDGFNANACEQFAAVIRDVNSGEMAFSYHLSPEWSRGREAHGAVFHANERHVEICLAAARELRVRDYEMPAIVSGRVIQMQNESNPSDLTDRTGAHQIVILWGSEQFGDIRVQTTLSPGDYLKALQAHEDWKPVRVQGTLRKRGRRWTLAEASSLGVIEQFELPFEVAPADDVSIDVDAA